jgi:hypothetical protein
MPYAAKLMNWGFAMDGKVRPVGVLVNPLPAHPVTQPAAGHTPAAQTPNPDTPNPHTQGALPPPAKLGVPGVPVLAGLGTLVLALLTSLVIAVVIRRGRRAESTPGGSTPGAGAPGGSTSDGSPPGGSPSGGT